MIGDPFKKNQKKDAHPMPFFPQRPGPVEKFENKMLFFTEIETHDRIFKLYTDNGEEATKWN